MVKHVARDSRRESALLWAPTAMLASSRENRSLEHIRYSRRSCKGGLSDPHRTSRFRCRVHNAGATEVERRPFRYRTVDQSGTCPCVPRAPPRSTATQSTRWSCDRNVLPRVVTQLNSDAPAGARRRYRSPPLGHRWIRAHFVIGCISSTPRMDNARHVADYRRLPLRGRVPSLRKRVRPLPAAGIDGVRRSE